MVIAIECYEITYKVFVKEMDNTCKNDIITVQNLYDHIFFKLLPYDKIILTYLFLSVCTGRAKRRGARYKAT